MSNQEYRSGTYNPEVTEKGDVHSEAQRLIRELNSSVSRGECVDLGPVVQRHDIKSSLSPFNTFGVHQEMSINLVDAYIDLLREHNDVMQKTIQRNIENGTDYQYINFDGRIINPFAQIDTRGLPQDFLDSIESVSPQVLKEMLRLGGVFEVEVSIAWSKMIGELNRQFKAGFNATLDFFRRKYNKEIAILGVEEDKYIGICKSEYGAENPPDNGIFITGDDGFDAVVGPKGLRELIRKYGDDLPYLFYVRPSLSPATLKEEGTRPYGILNDKDMRRIIRAHAITPNVDNPDSDWSMRLNDSKAPQGPMGLALVVAQENLGKKNEFEKRLRNFLLYRGFSEEDINTEKIVLRVKPGIDSYGGYGQSERKNHKLIYEVIDAELKKNNPLVLQPDMPTPQLHNLSNGEEYKYIHRIFVSDPAIGGLFLGGMQNLMPTTSRELKGKGRLERIHGNASAVWRPVVST